MSNSLFVERHSEGLTFYINGNLQFDTSDEALYHEYLVIPALALAAQRFPHEPLRVLILGGGDGLAARDVLRFAQVRDITLVDYDPEVLALARSEFLPYNQGSLQPDVGACLGAERVTVYVQDAFEFVHRLPDECYHVAIADFTCPTRPEDLSVFSLEWLTQVRRVLAKKGLFALNGVSPNKTPTAFWCLYQTLWAAGLVPKPMNLSIPSFQRLGYGDWGFFLASTEPIQSVSLAQIELPENLQRLSVADLLRTFQFPEKIAGYRHGLKLNTLEHPHLFYYLTNSPTIPPQLSEEYLDFLAMQDVGTGQLSTLDDLQLEAIAQRWIALLQENPDFAEVPSSHELIPIQHYHQTTAMTREWLVHGKALLAEIDPQKLIAQLLARSQELPPKLVQELKQWSSALRTGQPLTRLSSHAAELMTVLAVTLIVANLATPDAVYAKGSSSSFRSGSGSSGSTTYYSDGSYSDDGQFGWLGFLMMLIGGGWLYNLYQDKDDV
jgi:spermidine synthase